MVHLVLVVVRDMLFLLEFFTKTLAVMLEMVIRFLKISVLVFEIMESMLPFVTVFELLSEIVEIIFELLALDLLMFIVFLAILVFFSACVKLFFPVLTLPLVLFRLILDIMNSN
jgi:hypothetical protein